MLGINLLKTIYGLTDQEAEELLNEISKILVSEEFVERVKQKWIEYIDKGELITKKEIIIELLKKIMKL